MITSHSALARAALLVLAGLSLPNFAALALTDQDPPIAGIVNEDFSPLREHWVPASGNWSVGAGNYNSTAAGSADIATIVEYRRIDPAAPPTSALAFDQFSVSARMRNKGTTASQLVGLVFQYQDPANYFEAAISATGVVSLRRTRFGSTDTVASLILGIPRDTWVVMEVQWSTSVTKINVNGQLVITRPTQFALPPGQVGLAAHGAVGQYDKVRVTTPIGDQPFKHDFSSDAPGWRPQSGQWDVLNGTYNDAAVQQTNITLAPIDTGIIPGQQTIQYTLHARMLNPFAASGNRVGIIFNDRGSRYSEVVFSPTGVATMNLVSNGTVQTLATAAYGGRRNVWFDVTFDSTASVWVDGEQIFDHVPGANPDLAPMGGVGLITHWAPGKFDDVWFDHGIFTPCSEAFSNSTVPEVVSGTWNVNAGTLNGTSVNASSIARPCPLAGNPKSSNAGTDFVFSGRLLNQFGASGNLVGLLFNYQDPSDYNEVVFAPTGSGALNKVIQGVRYRVAEFPHSVPRNTWFDVQLFRSGIFTTVKVNGTEVIRDVPQGALRGGSTGVITHWTKASFDDLSVLPYVVRSPPLTYTLTHIATVPVNGPDTAQFNIFGLNDAGEIAGSRGGPDGKQQAFTWRDGVFRNLNPFLPANLQGAAVSGINNQSDVIGSYEDQQFQRHAFFMSKTGQLIPLTGVPSGSIDMIGINDQREILLSVRNGLVLQNFVWRNGQLTPLPLLPGNADMTALAINSLAVVVGYARTDFNRFTPVLWQDGAVMPLSFPPGADNSALSAALNDHGAVAARAIFRDVSPGRLATYVWHEGETTLLMPADPTLNQSAPDDINNRGIVIGVSFNGDTGRSVPTVWDGTRGQDLNTLIDRGDPRQPFVRLDTVRLINSPGQIVAHGVDSRRTDGLQSWYLLTPVAQH